MLLPACLLRARQIHCHHQGKRITSQRLGWRYEAKTEKWEAEQASDVYCWGTRKRRGKLDQECCGTLPSDAAARLAHSLTFESIAFITIG